MKIAEITTYKEGGIYTHVTELARNLHLPVILVTGNSKKSGYEQEDDFTFYHVPCLFSFFDIYFINPPGSFHKVYQEIKQQQVELLHIHGPLFTFGGGLLRKTGIPKVLTTHYILEFKGNRLLSFMYRIIIRLVTKSMAQLVDKIICVNEEYLPIFQQWGIEKEKMVYIPNGVDTEKFSPGVSHIKEKLKCRHLVVFWGRLGYQKNIQLLIKAFQRCTTSDTKLVIIGKGPDLAKLKQLAAKNKNIIFLGYLSEPDLLEYARGADVAVFPSRGESWGLVIAEAMAIGLPVISSNVGKAAELLGSDRGLLLNVETEENLAAMIDYVLQHKEYAQEMGKRARSYIVEHYSWKQVAEQTKKIYMTLLDK
ncbi:MAG: glycosyltransferase family 4 protein [Candidatus Thermoplasmatota archaeon]